MTRVNPVKHKIERVQLPLQVLENHRDVQLYMDFFYVNKIPFFFAISDKINYCTIDACKSKTLNTIKELIQHVLITNNTQLQEKNPL